MTKLEKHIEAIVKDSEKSQTYWKSKEGRFYVSDMNARILRISEDLIEDKDKYLSSTNNSMFSFWEKRLEK